MVVLWLAGAAALCPAQLSGTYTIDPAGTGTRNFKSFSSAVAALSGGVSGPVLFRVTPATYYESVSLPAVTGVSATSTIRFVAVGNPAVIDANGASIGLQVQMDGKYYHVENMIIRSFKQVGLHLNGQYVSPTWRRVTDCSFKNLTVDGPTGSNVVHTASFSQTYDTTCTGCRFLGGYHTLYSQGMARAVFDSCEFDGKGYAQHVLAPYNSNDADCMFRNCFVHDCSPTGSAVFLDLSHYGTMFWHNVFIATTTQETVRLGGCCAWSRASSFRNNIVVNMGAGPAIQYGWDGSASNPGLDYNDLDYNCYYAPNTTVGTVQLQPNSNGFAYAGSLAGWKTYFAANPNMVIAGGGSTYDPNSIEGNPGLVSLVAPYDIHLMGTSICFNAGTTKLIEGPWISYPPATTPPMPATVPQDFEGDNRPASSVDIGADEVAAVLSGAGSGQRGTPILFSLFAPSDAGLAYQMGSSFGNGPILFGSRQIELSPDSLLFVSVQGYLTMIFQNYAGFLDAQGSASARLNIPNIAALKGVRIYTAFLTLKPSTPSGVESISKAFLFTIQ